MFKMIVECFSLFRVANKSKSNRADIQLISYPTGLRFWNYQEAREA